MYYKILKGSELFAKFNDLQATAEECGILARNMAIRYGGKDPYHSSRTWAGGIDGICFDKKPQGWKIVGDPHEKIFYPLQSKQNENIIAEFRGLPRLQMEELNAAFNFESQIIGFTHYRSLGFTAGDEIITVEIPNQAKFNALPDMIEITGSEYREINEQINGLKQEDEK